MASWAAASVPYFLYIGVTAAVMPRLAGRSRVRAFAVAGLGLLVAVAGGYSPAFWLRLVLLPPLVLLLAYWSSGLLWTGAMPRVERALIRSDQALRIPALAARLPRIVIAILETAYTGIYPIIPIALLLHLHYSASPDADRFWTVILVTDFVCFGMLPWIQTRPPRAIEPAPPWRSPLRSFNVGMLARLSVGVNTVPSGHAAEALAAALVLSDAPAALAVWMWLAAAAISAGAVFGRYHYAVDAIAGWIVALVVWSLVN